MPQQFVGVGLQQVAQMSGDDAAGVDHRIAETLCLFAPRLLDDQESAGADDFRQMEWLGERAYALHDQPDAGIWELRTRARVHTSSVLMCWAALMKLSWTISRLACS